MNHKTDITIILDRSGSMAAIADDTIGGFNTFLEEQQKLSGDATLTLVKFDDQYEVEYSSKSMKDVPKLSKETFKPRGSTALLDAIGTTIDDIDSRLLGLKEEQRPDRMVVAIVTDGYENASHKFTKLQINQKISHKRDAHQWQFFFIGANQDAIQEGHSIGILAGQTLAYKCSKAGTVEAYSAMNLFVSNARTSPVNVAYSMTNEDRKKAEDSK